MKIPSFSDKPLTREQIALVREWLARPDISFLRRYSSMLVVVEFVAFFLSLIYLSTKMTASILHHKPALSNLPISLHTALFIFFGFLVLIAVQVSLDIFLSHTSWSFREITAENDASGPYIPYMGIITCQDALDFFKAYPAGKDYHDQVIAMQRPFLQGEIDFLRHHYAKQPSAKLRDSCRQLYAAE